MEGENAKQCMEGDTKRVGTTGCQEPSHPNLLVKALFELVEHEVVVVNVVDETALSAKVVVELETSAKLDKTCTNRHVACSPNLFSGL